MKYPWILLACTIVLASPSLRAETTNKPVTTIKETHEGRDHVVEADDVGVKRDKTVYAGSTGKSVNIRFKPVGFLVGLVGADVDFRLSRVVTLGPSVQYLDWTWGDTRRTAYSVGVRANLYPEATALEDHGWYIGPSLHYAGAKVERDSRSAELNGAILTVVTGYHWIWDSFNMMVGGGFFASSIGDNVRLRNANGNEEDVSVQRVGGTGPAFEFALGFAF